MKPKVKSTELAVDAGADIELPVGSTSAQVAANITGLAEGDYTVTVNVKSSSGNEATDQSNIKVLKPEPPVSTDPIKALKLINADKDEEVIEMREGGAYNLEVVGTKLNVKAETTPEVVKVKFELGGAMFKTYTDKTAPFSLHGDNGSGNYYYGNWNPPMIGEYNIKVIPYDASGKELTAKEMKFSFFKRDVSNIEPPNPVPTTQFYGFGAKVTGGSGDEVRVSNKDAFTLAVKDDTLKIVVVDGSFDIDYCYVGSNKTIKGVRGGVSGLSGTLRVEKAKNVLIQDLDLTAPIKDGKTYDAIAIAGSDGVIVDHCSIVDWTDGGCDIVKQATNVTVCNTLFRQTKSYDHALAVLIGSDPADPDEGFLDVTIYNCVFDEGITDRCPFARKGRIHLFNNVYQSYASWMYNGKVSSYVTAAQNAQIFAQNQVFINGEDPYIKKETGGRIKNTGDKFYPEVTKVVNWNDDVFVPPYQYELLPISLVEQTVLNAAGRFK